MIDWQYTLALGLSTGFALLASAVPSYRKPESEAQGHPAGEYEQCLATYRHYSALRFTIAGVFVGATAALFATVHGSLLPGLDAPLRNGLAFAGVILTLGFAYVEFVLNRYLDHFGSFLDQHFPHSHFATRPEWNVFPAIWLLYVAVLVTWLFVILRLLRGAASA